MGKEIVTYLYTVEYSLTIKNNEILPFVTTQIDLEGSMLSVMSQRNTNTMQSLLYVESKKKENPTKQ